MSPTPESRVGHLLDNHLELTGILGVGAYGVVYTAVDIYTLVPYAIKALSKIGLDARQKKFQAREIALHAKAQAHPNIVSLVEILDAPDCVYVVMEYCSEGDLFSVITEQGGYVADDEMARSVFLQLLDAVEYCHSLGIYHRDLKPENVLVGDFGRMVKLADFGLATTEEITADFGCGSTFYMSPECQATAPRSHTCYASAPNDVWSLGVILVNLTCGRNPWKRASAARDETYSAYLRDPNFLLSILPLSEELNHILKRIFDPNPSARITLPELRMLVTCCQKFTYVEMDDEIEDEEVEGDAEDGDLVLDQASEHGTVARPQTPAAPPNLHYNFQAPATPCSPNSKRNSFYRTQHTINQPPPTPVSPYVRGHGRLIYDSCSSIASTDSLCSHEQKEMCPPTIHHDFQQQLSFAMVDQSMSSNQFGLSFVEPTGTKQQQHHPSLHQHQQTSHPQLHHHHQFNNGAGRSVF